eukprot:626560-Prymnesium_polylepis.1
MSPPRARHRHCPLRSALDRPFAPRAGHGCGAGDRYAKAGGGHHSAGDHPREQAAKGVGGEIRRRRD